MSLKKGAVTASDQYRFREKNDARVLFGVIKEQHDVLPATDFAYGKRNRCPTPVNVVIGNYYGSKAAEV